MNATVPQATDSADKIVAGVFDVVVAASCIVCFGIYVCKWSDAKNFEKKVEHARLRIALRHEISDNNPV